MNNSMVHGSHAGAGHPIPKSCKKYKGTQRKWEEFYIKAAAKKNGPKYLSKNSEKQKFREKI